MAKKKSFLMQMIGISAKSAKKTRKVLKDFDSIHVSPTGKITKRRK